MEETQQVIICKSAKQRSCLLGVCKRKKLIHIGDDSSFEIAPAIRIFNDYGERNAFQTVVLRNALSSYKEYIVEKINWNL